MPELPDLTVYLDFMAAHIVGETLERIRVASPFVLRTTRHSTQSKASACSGRGAWASA
jgi:formamidopyrimidine-DNA glycosylase